MADDRKEGFWSPNADDAMSPEEAAALLGSSPEQPQTVEYAVPVDDVVDQLAYEVQSEPSEDDPDAVRTLMSDARLRLEQGRLYEMLIEHSLFADVNANPDAIKNVEKEIKRFIRERLEVLLGIRPDPRLAPQAPVQAVGQFNQFEVDVLKSFVRRASNGASDKFDAPAAPAPVVQPLATGTIRPLGQVARPAQPIQQVQRPAVKVVPRAAPAATRAPQVTSSPLVPSKGGTPTMVVKDVDGSRVVIPAENESPLEKAASSMKRGELAERSRRIADRHVRHRKQALGPNHIPTIPLDQSNAMVTAVVLNRTGQGSLANGIPLMPIVNGIIARKMQQGE